MGTDFFWKMKFTLCMIAMAFTVTQASNDARRWIPDPHTRAAQLKTVQAMVKKLDLNEVSVSPEGYHTFMAGCNKILREVLKLHRDQSFSEQELSQLQNDVKLVLMTDRRLRVEM